MAGANANMLRRLVYLSSIQRNYLKKCFSYCIGRRHFLSAAYACQDAWEKRLEFPLLWKINMVDYFIELDRKLGSKKKLSAVDVDLFVNNVTRSDQLDQVEHLIRRFRRTRNTVHTLDSTHHAVVRSYMVHNRYQDLLKILRDPINCGIFPDYYCYNMFMDNLLKEENYRDAAKVAISMMWQEDFDHPISRALALYSCHMYLMKKTPEPWDTEPSSPLEEQEDEEEVLVRVPFLRNPYFDDHFDITNPNHLLGKTLNMIGRGYPDLLGRTCQVVGLAMYEKWEKLQMLLQAFLAHSDNLVIAKEGCLRCQDSLAAITDDEAGTRTKWTAEIEPLLQELQNKTRVSEASLQVLVEEKVKEIPAYEALDIEAQKRLFLEWEKQRQKALDDQVEEYRRQERIKAIEVKKKELAEREQLLFFFENWNKHELELAEVEKLEAELQTKKEEEEYIPPDVHQPQVPAKKVPSQA